MGLKEILPITVLNFYNDNKNISESVLKKFSLRLNGIFETAIENDLCFKNPSKGISPASNAEKHKKEVYTDLQIRCVKILARDKIPEAGLLLETGLHRGELLGLKWGGY